jgi:hypothetical protein
MDVPKMDAFYWPGRCVFCQPWESIAFFIRECENSQNEIPDFFRPALASRLALGLPN